MANAMDRQKALQTLLWCDQIEQALLDNNQDIINLLRGKLVFHFAKAEEVDIRVAVECARARANEVLRG
jgi:hypothetical protein